MLVLEFEVEGLTKPSVIPCDPDGISTSDTFCQRQSLVDGNPKVILEVVASSRLHTEDTVVWHYQEINNSFQKSSYRGTRKTLGVDFGGQVVSRGRVKSFPLTKLGD